MKIAYLILAHKYPQQLQRLLNRLDSPNCEFFVHIDKKSGISSFKGMHSEFSKIKFIKREDGQWGRIGIIRAIINGLKMVPEKQFDYICLVTGQCYPVKSKDAIENFFKSNYGKSYISHFPLPSPKTDWPNGGLDRIERYHFYLEKSRTFPPDRPSTTLQGKVLDNIFKLYFKMPRQFPEYVRPYGGSAFFALTMDNVSYILDFLKKHPDYMKYHKYTISADEIFFQSILLSSENKRVSGIVCDDLRYVDWNKPVRPAILGKEDFNAIINSGKLFARKFDMNVDSKILDMIDAHCSYTPRT